MLKAVDPSRSGPCHSRSMHGVHGVPCHAWRASTGYQSSAATDLPQSMQAIMPRPQWSHFPCMACADGVRAQLRSDGPGEGGAASSGCADQKGRCNVQTSLRVWGGFDFRSIGHDARSDVCPCFSPGLSHPTTWSPVSTSRTGTLRRPCVVTYAHTQIGSHHGVCPCLLHGFLLSTYLRASELKH